MPVALTNVDLMLVVEPAGMVDRRVIVLEYGDARLVNRPVVLEKLDRVRNHGGVPSGALEKTRSSPIAPTLALIWRNRAAALGPISAPSAISCPLSENGRTG